LTANDREKYATYTRDSATGLDYAMNRYYASQWGRYLSPDPSSKSIKPGNPQSWNRYPYVDGDPANHTDPSGLDPTAQDCIANPDLCLAADGNQQGNDGLWGDGLPCGFGYGTVCGIIDPGSGCVDSSPGSPFAPMPPTPTPVPCPPPPPAAGADCDISLAYSGAPEGPPIVGSALNAPLSNQLGPYSTIGRAATPPAYQGWFFAVQLQGTLYGDTDPASWVPIQFAAVFGTVTYKTLGGAVINAAVAIPDQLDGPPDDAVYSANGTLDWIDFPGWSYYGPAKAGAVVTGASLTFTFNSTLWDPLAGASCSTNWSLHLYVKGSFWQWDF